MVAKSPRILLVADQVPSSTAGMSGLMGRPDLRFHVTSVDKAVDELHAQDYGAAIVLAPHAYFNGSQQKLVRVLDALCAQHVGAVMLTFSPEDLHSAERLVHADGLLAVPHTCSLEELSGCIAGLLAAKPMVDQLQRENAMLRKFDSGLNNQMTQLDEEMRLAARLQVDFLPRKLPELNGCSFDVLFRPASYVSGDIYDAIRLDENHLGFYVADAVGHGMPAALLTIFIKRALKTKEILDNQELGKGGYRLVFPDEAITHLNNEMLAQQLSMCQFVTMVYGILNTKTLELSIARAGHPLPIHLKANGECSDIDIDGALLGVFADEQFSMRKVQLQPGDSVMLYSDGFETAFPEPAGAVNERYRSEFARLAGPHSRQRFSELVTALDNQEGSLHPHDDLTALMLSVRA